tara:strand:+ start:371 stop:589 length:219 start_codon:yes stop_codon:yes gene_type:complete
VAALAACLAPITEVLRGALSVAVEKVLLVIAAGEDPPLVEVLSEFTLQDKLGQLGWVKLRTREVSRMLRVLA